ncbi:MAG: hypothetical protein ACREF4_12950 [Gammaproteobacteria bacterium]
MTKILGGTGLVGALVLGLQVGVGTAQLAPLNFPDTAVGATSTLKCPDTGPSICFGSNCTGSGTVLSVSGPSLPFKIGKLNLLTLDQFFAGSCGANPVSLPVAVAPNQVLAYEATFSPTSAGTFNGSLTFNTGGGPATAALTGKAIAGRTDRGGLLLKVSPEHVTPAGLVTLEYETTKGNLQGNVDLYLEMVLPSGQSQFVTEQGGLASAIVPFRRNVSVSDGTQPLFSDRAPLGIPFGTYTFHMMMVYTGADGANPQNWASPRSSAALTYAALSPEQASIKTARGNPDLLVVTWLPDVNQKRETWMYLAGSPNKFEFLNGETTSESSVALSPADIGPKLDPALFTPQTTLDSLTAALGPPTSVSASDGAPEFQLISYAVGLDVVLLNGQLSSAVTSAP